MNSIAVRPDHHWRQLLLPLLVTVLLAAWTLIVSPYSRYGDNWAVWPAVLAAPVVVLWHIVLASRFPGWRSSIFGILHLLVFTPIWLVCLMAISKDSL